MILIVSLEEYFAYSVSVSAVEILFASNIAAAMHQSSRQRLRYQLEIGKNLDF